MYDSEDNTVEAEIVWSVVGDIGEIDENGLFTAAVPGTGAVVAAVGEIEAQSTVTVKAKIDSIVITPEEADVVEDEKIEFTAEVYDTEGNIVETEIVWSVEGDIGEIDENGEFTATTFGTGSVVAAVGEITAQVTVTVEPKIRMIVITPDAADILIREEKEFIAEVYNSLGNVVEEEEVEVIWTVEGGIGEIDEEGLFTATVPGTGSVVAAIGEITAQAAVTVLDVQVWEYKPIAGETAVLFGIDYPLDFMNGTKLNFPEDSFTDDIEVTFTLPIFAQTDSENEEVTFDGGILTAVTFHVSVNDEVISPYFFDIPVEISIPYDIDVLNELGLDPQALGMFFVDPTGELTSEGISNVVVDEDLEIIYAKVAHFSDVAVAPKYSGIKALEGLTSLMGDFDNNLNVDFLDYTQLVVYWNADISMGDITGKADGQNVAGSPPWDKENYPYAPDGVIDFEDYMVFALMYNWYQSLTFEGAAKPVVSVAKRTPTSFTGLYWNKDDYKVGDTFIISLNPGNVSNFMGAEIVLNYDSDILKVNDVKTGPVLNMYDDCKSPVLYQSSDGNLTASTIVLGNMNKGLTIAGLNLFDIEFEVIGEGAFDIDLISMDLRNYQNNSISVTIDKELISGMAEASQETAPLAFGLSQNFPNPFNLQTTINYSLDRTGKVDIRIYNTLGQQIRTLIDETRSPGQYSVVWNGTDDDGNVVTSGVYFIRMIQGDRVDNKRMVLIK